MGALLANNFIVPLPNLSGDGLTDRAESSQVLEVAANVLVTGALEQSQGCRGNVELSDVVLLDDIPVP